MSPSHRATPRALHQAKLWTAGLITASTVLVGAVGVHLAEAQTQTVATQSVTQAASSAANSSGFGAVAPLSGSAAGAQSSSGGS